MTTIIDIIQGLSNIDNYFSIKKIIGFILDVSGSTGAPFPNIDNITSIRQSNLNKSILVKELSVIKEIILDENRKNSESEFFIVSFATTPSEPNEITVFNNFVSLQDYSNYSYTSKFGGNTYTHKALENILKSYSLGILYTDVYIVTDGQTNSSSNDIKRLLTELKDKGIKIHIISITNINLDLANLSNQDQLNVAGYDLINYSGNIVNELIIYANNDTPFKFSQCSAVNVNELTLCGIPIPKKMIPFINEVINKIKENEDSMIYGNDYYDSKDFLYNIGSRMILLTTSFPNNLSEIENYPQISSFITRIIQELISIKGFLELSPNEISSGETISNIIFAHLKHGFKCTKENKPIINSGSIADKLKESSVKKNEFNDANKELESRGTIHNSNILVSLPFNGFHVIIHH